MIDQKLIDRIRLISDRVTNVKFKPDEQNKPLSREEMDRMLAVRKNVPYISLEHIIIVRSLFHSLLSSLRQEGTRFKLANPHANIKTVMLKTQTIIDVMTWIVGDAEDSENMVMFEDYITEMLKRAIESFEKELTFLGVSISDEEYQM